MKALFQSNTISSKNIVLIKLCILIERLMAIHLVVTGLFVTDRCRVTSLHSELWWLVAEGRNTVLSTAIVHYQNLCGRWFKGKYIAIKYKFELVTSRIMIRVMKKSSAWSLISLLKIHKWDLQIPICVRETWEQALQEGTNLCGLVFQFIFSAVFFLIIKSVLVSFRHLCPQSPGCDKLFSTFHLCVH